MIYDMYSFVNTFLIFYAYYYMGSRPSEQKSRQIVLNYLENDQSG